MQRYRRHAACSSFREGGWSTKAVNVAGRPFCIQVLVGECNFSFSWRCCAQYKRGRRRFGKTLLDAIISIKLHAIPDQDRPPAQPGVHSYAAVVRFVRSRLSHACLLPKSVPNAAVVGFARLPTLISSPFTFFFFLAFIEKPPRNVTGNLEIDVETFKSDNSLTLLLITM